MELSISCCSYLGISLNPPPPPGHRNKFTSRPLVNFSRNLPSSAASNTHNFSSTIPSIITAAIPSSSLGEGEPWRSGKSCCRVTCGHGFES
ncbi:hypothetical protein OROGR_006742 [Orobanche gracilis]